MIITRNVDVRERAAVMSLHFEDVDPVAECHIEACAWHGHADSVIDAVWLWTRHLAVTHSQDWE